MPTAIPSYLSLGLLLLVDRLSIIDAYENILVAEVSEPAMNGASRDDA